MMLEVDCARTRAARSCHPVRFAELRAGSEDRGPPNLCGMPQRKAQPDRAPERDTGVEARLADGVRDRVREVFDRERRGRRGCGSVAGQVPCDDAELGRQRGDHVLPEDGRRAE